MIVLLHSLSWENYHMHAAVHISRYYMWTYYSHIWLLMKWGVLFSEEVVTHALAPFSYLQPLILPVHAGLVLFTEPSGASMHAFYNRGWSQEKLTVSSFSFLLLDSIASSGRVKKGENVTTHYHDDDGQRRKVDRQGETWGKGKVHSWWWFQRDHDSSGKLCHYIPHTYQLPFSHDFYYKWLPHIFILFHPRSFLSSLAAFPTLPKIQDECVHHHRHHQQHRHVIILHCFCFYIFFILVKKFFLAWKEAK